MDRISGASTIDIGGGRRGFRDEDLPTGVEGTVVTAAHLNAVQEEILKVIVEAGLDLDDSDWSQLWQALQILGLSDGNRRRRWMAVISMSVTAPPAGAATGDVYLIPAAATGVWTGNVGKLAEWTGTAWSYVTPPDGHGISLPDGRVFERIAGTYIEKIALDVQSGKWTYAVASGTANAWIVDPFLAVPAYSSGRVLFVVAPATNTSTTVNANVSGLGNRRIKKADGTDPQPGDLVSGRAYPTLDDGTNIRVLSPLPSDRLSARYLGFHGDPVSQSIAPTTPTIISAYTGIINNLPNAAQAGGIVTIGTDGFYNVTANLLSLMPTVGSGSYSYALTVSKVNAGGVAIASIAALPVLATTASMNSLAGSAAGVVKLSAGERIAAFMQHNLPGTNINVSTSLDVQFLGA